MLLARDLQCRRGGRVVLAGLSVALHAGELLGVLGANGAGKSSLLAALAGELRAEAGAVELAGRPLAQWPAAAQARRRALLPQSPSLEFALPVRTVVAMGAYPFPEVTPRALDVTMQRVLALADAESLAGRSYLALSGGEQQRVQFARVLVQLLAGRSAGEYRALLLDEPTASLDPKHQLMLLGAVRALTRDEGIAGCVVLHDANLAAQFCDRLLLLADGAAVALGPPSIVLTPAHLQRVYGLAAQVIEHPRQRGRSLVLFEMPQA